MSIEPEDVRPLFESWWLEGFPPEYALVRDEFDEYRYTEKAANIAFNAWCAAFELLTSDAAAERAARAIFDTAVGPQHWDDEYYCEERSGCLVSASAVLLAASTVPTAERG